jgi:NACHT domain
VNGRTWVRVGVAGLALALASVAANQAVSTDHLPDRRWLGVAIALSVLATAAGLRLNSRIHSTAAEAAGPADMASTLEALATVVESVWKPEQSRRRLLNPHPLPTTWVTISPPVADHWANVRSDGIDEPLHLDGVVDLAHPDGFYQVMIDKRLRGRIVLLGEPGAGKTALLIRLTCTLLAARRHAALSDRPQPVPVLLRLTTWNPEEQVLEQWVASQLATEYGHPWPVNSRQLIPLLDGLDEMPEHRRQRALLSISNTFIDAPLVVTSRTGEYLTALTAVVGCTMGASVVLELAALPAPTVRAYLGLTTGRPIEWESVLDTDIADHGGQLAAALSAPLWVDLARMTYTDPDRTDNDPAELLGPATPDAVHMELLDRLVPSAYPDRPNRSRIERQWQQADARRWLEHLAVDMRRRDTQDIAWWQLTLAIPRQVRIVVAFALWLAVWFICGVAVWLAASLAGRPFRLMIAVAAGLIGGILFGQLISFGEPNSPSRRQIRWQRTNQSVVRQFVDGLPFAFTFGSLVVVFYELVPVPIGVRAAGVGLAFVFGLIDAFTTFVRLGDADVEAASDPVGLLRADRRRLLPVGIGFGLLFGVAFGPPLAFGVGLSVELGVGIMVGVGFVVGGAGDIVDGAWIQLELARLWWWTHGWLPWRIMEFLSDAQTRGVLRQAGGVWQFRHVLLRDRLAETSTGSINHPGSVDTAGIDTKHGGRW